jgi:alpha-beta hydrolase superfamily lysophospholipase
MDFHLEIKGGKILKGIIQSPGDNVRAAVILLHGLGEHIQRYRHVADFLNRNGIAFAGVDFPGHGRSSGRRGAIKNYESLDQAIDVLLKTISQTFPGIPVYMYGHSLGGAILLNYLIRKNPKVKGAVVTSPWLRLSFEPSGSTMALASVLRRIAPWLRLPNGLKVDHISHDKDVVELYKTDPLNHDKISVSFFYSAVLSGRYSLEHASMVKIPVLLVHGSDDHITSPDASREFASKSGKVELKIWPGGYHELHNEPFKDEVLEFILSWINKSRK